MVSWDNICQNDPQKQWGNICKQQPRDTSTCDGCVELANLVDVLFSRSIQDYFRVVCLFHHSSCHGSLHYWFPSISGNFPRPWNGSSILTFQQKKPRDGTPCLGRVCFCFKIGNRLFSPTFKGYINVPKQESLKPPPTWRLVMYFSCILSESTLFFVFIRASPWIIKPIQNN